ncbi:hypothetical protein Q5752_001401 [Cryptotrichosporon argae]
MVAQASPVAGSALAAVPSTKETDSATGPDEPVLAPLRLSSRSVMYHYVPHAPMSGLPEGLYGYLGETYGDTVELVRRHIPRLAHLPPHRITLHVPPYEDLKHHESGWCRVLEDAWPALLADGPRRIKVWVADEVADKGAAVSVPTTDKPRGEGGGSRAGLAGVSIVLALLGSFLVVATTRPTVPASAGGPMLVASVLSLTGAILVAASAAA